MYLQYLKKFAFKCVSPITKQKSFAIYSFVDTSLNVKTNFNLNDKSCLFINKQFTRGYSTKNEEVKKSSIIQSHSNEQQQLSTHVSVGKKVKQAAYDLTYIGVILIGVGIVAIAGYYLYKELGSRETPTGIYNESSKICLESYQLQDALGAPIKVSAESGGRRVFQIRHKYIFENNILCMLVNYYMTGARNKATIHVKVKQSLETGKFEYEYIIAELDYPYRGENKIIIKRPDDNNK